MAEKILPTTLHRGSGILLHISSLPSPYGIGTLGQSAYDFVDFLKAAGQRYWQILPLGPTGFGDSPYQSFSAYAGNPYFIDLDILKAQGLLTLDESHAVDFGDDPKKVDYGKLYRGRLVLLERAYERFLQSKVEGWEIFQEENAIGLRIIVSIWQSIRGRVCPDSVEERISRPGQRNLGAFPPAS